jgi:hypothetical protein
MNEDLLTPLMGRLIDRAKAAVVESASGAGGAEGVALLLDDETIVAAGVASDVISGLLCAAALALEAARAQGGQVVEAAAVALSDSSLKTVVPSAASREALESIDPALPVVAKLRGRWVVRLLSEFPGCADPE